VSSCLRCLGVAFHDDRAAHLEHGVVRPRGHDSHTILGIGSSHEQGKSHAMERHVFQFVLCAYRTEQSQNKKCPFTTSVKRLKKIHFCKIYRPLFARASLQSCRSSSAVLHPLSIHTLLQYLSLCPHHNRTLTPTHDTSFTRTRTNSDSTPLIPHQRRPLRSAAIGV
jgi:hypothetical protein